MQQWLKEVARGKRGSKDLSYEETLSLASYICEGKATDAQIAAYLIAERMKTESPEELLAFIQVLEQKTDKIRLKDSRLEKVIDFAGPYTGRNLFAATIPVAILLAEQEIPIFLHSSQSLPPKYGASLLEIVEQLGVKISDSADTLSRIIETTNLGFAWTDKFCPTLGELRNIRTEIGVRTLLNTAEKLLNITSAKSIILGAYHRTAINKIVPIFQNLSYENIYIVQGVEGSEDLPVHRNSFIYKVIKGEMETFIVKPEDYGLFSEEQEKVKLTASEQASKIIAILSGDDNQSLTYERNQVLFNAGIRYFLFGRCKSIEEGIYLANQQLIAKRGIEKLDIWRESSQIGLRM